jgi:hypothetical protein
MTERGKDEERTVNPTTLRAIASLSMDQLRRELTEARAAIAQLQEQAQLYIDQREMTLAAKRQADARVVELEQAARAILTAVRGDEHGEYHTIRRLLDKRGIFHDNLTGLRVVEELPKSLLARSAEVKK